MSSSLDLETDVNGMDVGFPRTRSYFEQTQSILSLNSVEDSKEAMLTVSDGFDETTRFGEMSFRGNIIVLNDLKAFSDQVYNF